MVRLGFVLLAQALARRVEVKDHTEAGTFAHLSEEDSLAAVHALEILEQLKEGSTDGKLQEQYGEAIGEIEWEEDKAFLLSGMSANQAPVMLGQPSQTGATLSLMELLTGRLGEMSWFTTRLGRLFTNRRDFAIEEEGGETKYMIDGITASLHSRMQISFPNEAQPRFVVRRAFNYLNPIATTVGQYIYRVLRCEENSEGGWAGACTEGEILYTITKDRLGRGALWGQDEYRVYTGTGGCRRWGHGVLSCSSELQIMYSLSTGLSSGTHDTNFYEGKINALDSGFDSGRLHTGEELDASAIEAMKVATVSKFEGSPRALNWPIWLPRLQRDVQALEQGRRLGEIAGTLSEFQIDIITGNAGLNAAQSVQAFRNTLTPAQTAMFGALELGAEAFQAANGAIAAVAWAYHLAKSLIWADSYHVAFDGNPTDELLVSVVAAIQDLTREQIAVRPAGNNFQMR